MEGCENGKKSPLMESITSVSPVMPSRLPHDALNVCLGHYHSG
jgi:hypothetical protein